MYCLPAVHIFTLALSHILQYSGPMYPSVYFSAVLLLDAPTTYADTSGLKCNKEKVNHTIIKCNCIFKNQNQKFFFLEYLHLLLKYKPELRNKIYYMNHMSELEFHQDYSANI